MVIAMDTLLKKIPANSTISNIFLPEAGSLKYFLKKENIKQICNYTDTMVFAINTF